MIYKVRYEHDNGYRKDDKVAVITSEVPLRSKLEVKDFFYHYIYMIMMCFNLMNIMILTQQMIIILC